MRKLLSSFLLGCLIGASVILALLELRPTSKEREALRTLDFVINEWTADRTSEIRPAQLPAHKEIPDARPGHVPDTVIALSKRLHSLYNIPTSITIAQWILESSWGRNNLGASNYFGHTLNAVLPFKKDSAFVLRREKVPAPPDTTPEFATGRPVRFASYTNIVECFDVHGQYLSRSKRYRSVFETASWEAFARGLSKAGYATDPEYALKLITIIKRYRLLDHGA